MTRAMKDSGVEWIGLIPERWKIIRNKYLMTKVKIIKQVYEQEPILSLTMNGVIKRDLDNPTGKMPTTFDGYQILKPNNLLMCLFDIDVTPRCIGIISEYGLSSPAYSQFVLNIELNTKYAYYYYLNLDFTKELLHLAKNLRHSLTEEQLGYVPVPLPPLPEQQAIADYLDDKCAQIDNITATINEQIDVLKQYKKSVITEAVTKGLDPNVPMKDSGVEWIGEIPEKWEVKPLYCFFNERKNKNFNGQETNLLSLSYGNIIRKNINATEGLLPENFNSYNIIEAGDIVFRLTDLQNDKRSLRTGLVKEKGIITSAYVTVKPIKNLVNSYFHYLLHSYDVAKVFYNMGNGVRQGLNFDELKKLLVLNPTISEQQAIANYLDDKCAKIDAVIADKQAQLEILAAYKKSLIYEYVTGKKSVPGFEEA